MTTKRTETPILDAYTALNSISKEIVRVKIQNLLGYSTATIYNKLNDESGLNKLEETEIKKILSIELTQVITFNTNHLKQLENENFKRK